MATTRRELQLSTGTPATLVHPDGDGPWPGVVMIHEVFGVDDVLLRQADRLARAGYLVLAPDLFSEGRRLKCISRAMKEMQSGQGRAFELIEAARDRLRSDDSCSGRVGVIGFCMGGGFALLSSNRDFDAGSVNYGMIPKDPDSALVGACPLVGSYGGKDTRLTRDLPSLKSALTRLDVPHDIKVYPTAGHSFLNDAENGPRLLRPLMRVAHVGPDPAAAEDAWRRIEAFFDEHLASGEEV